MSDEQGDRPPMALATEWVSRITTVSLEMVLPGLGGVWLDGKLGTHYWALVGFGVGLCAGMWHLLQMTKGSQSNKRPGDYKTGGNDSSDRQ